MEIKITCKGADLLPLDAIEEFQGGLKKRTKRDIDLIIKSIEKYGFSFPFFVWNGSGHNYCLDGHGRIQALAEMRRRGVSLPLFPVVYIEAKDEEEAKQKILRINSQYGQITLDTLQDFTKDLNIEWDDILISSGVIDFSAVDDHFLPNITPEFGSKLVIEKDISKTNIDIEKRFAGSKTDTLMITLYCPYCNEPFEIQKEDLEKMIAEREGNE